VALVEAWNVMTGFVSAPEVATFQKTATWTSPPPLDDAVVPLLYWPTRAHPLVAQVMSPGSVACFMPARTRSMSPVEWVGSVTVCVFARTASHVPGFLSVIATGQVPR
jgi:hypothetical protein